LTGMKHIEVGALIRDKKLYDSWNEEFDVSEFDEDKVCDELEEILADGRKQSSMEVRLTCRAHPKAPDHC
jgi:broad-specificity NMP kinase